MHRFRLCRTPAGSGQSKDEVAERRTFLALRQAEIQNVVFTLSHNRRPSSTWPYSL